MKKKAAEFFKISFKVKREPFEAEGYIGLFWILLLILIILAVIFR